MKEKTRLLSDFDFPLSSLDRDSMYDHELKNRLPIELFLKHEGHNVNLEGKIYELTLSKPSDVISLNITTFRGISIGAIHYYGTLNLPRISYRIHGTNITHGGFGFPSILHRIELTRQISLEEIKKDPERFSCWSEGDNCSGFYAEKGIVKQAKTISKKYFPGFKLNLGD